MRTEKKELNIQIGKRLQIARENSGYTQEEFAETLDVGVEHYRKVEFGIYGLQRENMLILYESRYGLMGAVENTDQTKGKGLYSAEC